MPERTALANYIKDFRKTHRESQEEFAENCGLSKDFLSLVERERANPSLEAMQKIASYTGETVAEILTIKKKDEE